MSEELKRLMQKVHHAKNASMFEAKEAAGAALDQAVRLLQSYEVRIERLEKLYANVEPLK